jgi:hypothetical protein
MASQVRGENLLLLLAVFQLRTMMAEASPSFQFQDLKVLLMWKNISLGAQYRETMAFA